MKVGNLHFYKLCGSLEIVVGPNPCTGTLGAFFILSLFSFMFYLMSTSITSSYFRGIAYTGIIFNIILFICLNLSNPGVPK